MKSSRYVCRHSCHLDFTGICVGGTGGIYIQVTLIYINMRLGNNVTQKLNVKTDWIVELD